MALVDEVKRRAARARFEAERQVRLNRTQARVGALQGQLNTSVTRLGYLIYDLVGRDEIDHPQIAPFRAQLDGLRDQISQAEAEVRAIQAEGFVEEPQDTACAVCGVTNPPAARFCRGCGRPIGQMVGPTGARAEASQEISCPNCGAASPPGMRFCLQCGKPLSRASDPSPTAAAPPPVSQSSPLVLASWQVSQEAPTVLVSDPRQAPPVTTAGPEPALGTEAAPSHPGEARAGEVAEPPLGEPPLAKPAASQATESIPASPPPIEGPEPGANCPACGEPIPPGAVFCVGCGEPVGG